MDVRDSLRSTSTCHPRQNGFTYLGLLFLIALLAVVSSTVGALWSIERKREKERELIFVGGQFRQAIASYYERSPGTVKEYPRRLEDLVADNRFVIPMRHLRKIYRDPLTQSTKWGELRGPEGGIRGVYSSSDGKPIKKRNFAGKNSALADKKLYREWVFAYVPATKNAH